MSLRGKFKGLINPLNFSQLVTQVLTTSEVICILNYMVNVDLGTGAAGVQVWVENGNGTPVRIRY